MITFETPPEERTFGRSPSSGNAVCLIHDNLESGTLYYFCVKAYNTAGSSETSNIINCKTLTDMDTAIPGNQRLLLKLLASYSVRIS